jgi:hypothetical protein
MRAIDKAEIARVDRAHRRADEAVEQMRAGHIITTCDVLFEDENNGVRVTWTADELESWPSDKLRLIKYAVMQQYGVILPPSNGLIHIGDPDPQLWHDTYKPVHTRARMMYRQSAACVAVHPLPDPYANNRQVEESILSSG